MSGVGEPRLEIGGWRTVQIAVAQVCVYCVGGRSPGKAWAHQGASLYKQAL